MARPEHNALVFSGIMGSVSEPLEEWSFRVSGDAGEPLGGFTDADAAEAKDAWSTHLGTIATTDTHLTQVKFMRVDPLGRVARDAQGGLRQGAWQGDVAGVVAPRNMPLQTALVVSLTTERYGPTGKGRFFLPWPGFTLNSSTKLLPVAEADAVADQAKLFLQAIGPILGGLRVVSSKGYMSAVTGLRVGRRADVLRSRAERQDEGYSVRTL